MRRLRKILFFIILSAWTLTSCEKDTGTETVNVPIGFSNNVTTATRAGDINNDNLTSIGVFASLTHGNFDATVSTPNFMYNQLVEKKNGTWQYTPLKYWPNNDSDKISFFAYAPHNATGVTPKGLSFIHLHYTHSRSRPGGPACRHPHYKPKRGQCGFQNATRTYQGGFQCEK